MPHLRLRGPLKDLAGGSAQHELVGATVGEVLGTLEREHPAVAGWIVDERGQLRRHINVFVNGEWASGTTVVADGDRVEVIPAISGGST
jgi:molybdopterin synthase sulfur carrier subunit